jgi:hypothetical protein
MELARSRPRRIIVIYNESPLDRIVRIALGALLVSFAFIGPRTAWAAALGLVLLMTGLVGFCPLYRVFGIRTCKVRS